MKTRLLTLSILFVSFSSFFACKDSTTGNQLRTIHFEQCIANEREMKISEIADTVAYIELKTPKEIVVARIFNIVPADNFWVIHTPDGIFKFTQEGEFIKQIGRQGQGPDEYLHILGVDINPERKEIVQADTQGILYYDYDGNFLRKVKINDYFFNIVYAHSTLWTCNLCMHIDKYMACAFSLEGDTLAAMPNPNYGIESLNTDGFYFTSSSELREFSKYKGELFMKTRSSRDTVYRLSGPKWEPYLYFDMGKYSMPIEYEIWYSKSAYEKMLPIIGTYRGRKKTTGTSSLPQSGKSLQVRSADMKTIISISSMIKKKKKVLSRKARKESKSRTISWEVLTCGRVGPRITIISIRSNGTTCLKC